MNQQQQDQDIHQQWTTISIWTSIQRMFTSTAEIQKTTRRQHRRVRNALEEDLDEAHDEHLRLIRKNNELRARCDALNQSNATLSRENAVTRDVLYHMSNRSEAFRMTLAHLHQAWSPQQPDSDPLKNKEAVTALMETQCQALVDDAGWIERRDGRFADYLRSQMQEATGLDGDTTVAAPPARVK
ncbi:MAG: hypothetical protein P4L92_00045 [Rudaea sp.]|nr:hypothetical protein [Rudaea sp.]